MNYGKLITILKKELASYEALYELAVEKTEIIKKGNINALNQMMKEEQTLITSIQTMENERQKELRKQYPDRPDLPTLSKCIEDAGQDEKEILAELHTKLMNVLNQVKERNDLNQQLIVQSLQFVNFSLGLMYPKTDNLTYGPSEGKQQAAKDLPSIFDSQA